MLILYATEQPMYFCKIPLSVVDMPCSFNNPYDALILFSF
jgi:hypothetical protein